MNKNSAQRFLPLIVALCLIAGILIGSFYANHFTGNRLSIIGSYFTMFVFGELKSASARAARTKTSQAHGPSRTAPRDRGGNSCPASAPS